jgi:hypothetical protein
MNVKKNLFKNKVQMVTYIIFFFLLIGCFIYLGNQNFGKKETEDRKKFDNDFTLVDENNIYKYVNNTEARTQINSGNTIVFFGTKNNEWVNYYAKILNDAAKDAGIAQIYYYDFISDRDSKNGTYQSIVNSLSNYLVKNDEDKYDIYAPTLVVIKNKEVIYFDDQTSLIHGKTTPKEYWNDYKTNEVKATLKTVFKKYVENNNGK